MVSCSALTSSNSSIEVPSTLRSRSPPEICAVLSAGPPGKRLCTCVNADPAVSARGWPSPFKVVKRATQHHGSWQGRIDRVGG